MTSTSCAPDKCHECYHFFNYRLSNYKYKHCIYNMHAFKTIATMFYAQKGLILHMCILYCYCLLQIKLKQ